MPTNGWPNCPNSKIYTPIFFVTREVLKDLILKDINISKRYINMQSPIPILQCLCDLWGPDAHIFKSEIFAHGIVGAYKTPWAYIPFWVRYCVCACQYFATTEPKVVLSLMLFKFRFSLFPSVPAFMLIGAPWKCSYCSEDNLTFFSFEKCKGHLGCTCHTCHYYVAIRELEKRIKRDWDAWIAEVTLCLRTTWHFSALRKALEVKKKILDNHLYVLKAM